MEPIPPMPDQVFDEKEAQLSLHRRHKPTNPLATAFGEVTGDMKKFLRNLKGEKLKSRKQWLALNEGNTMPHGPYPIVVRNHGRMQAFLSDVHFQACYIARADRNMDVQIYRMEYDENGAITKKTSVGAHPDMLVPATFLQEKYNPKSGHFNICYEKVNKMKVKEVKNMIHNEVFSWAMYDEYFQQEVAKAEQARLKPRRSAKRRLPFTGIRSKKARGTGPEAEVSTCLLYTSDAADEL